MAGMNDLLRGAIPVVVLLITVALVIAIGAEILIKNQQIYDVNDFDASIVNETQNLTINGLNVTVILDNDQVDNETISIFGARNGTGLESTGDGMGLINPIGNYTTTEVGGVILTNPNYYNLDYNISYTFQNQVKDAAFNGTAQGLVGIETFSSFQPTFAVILIAVLIIGLLVVGFGAIGIRVINR